MGFWAVALPIAASLLGNHITATAQNRATKRRLDSEAAGRARRTAKANQLTEKFQQVAQQIGPEQEQALMSAEDAKNLKSFNDTEQNADVKIGQGLNLGGRELAQFTDLQNDRNSAVSARNNARKLFHSQFLSPNAVQSQRGNYADELQLGRSRLADELVGDKIGDDLETSAIQPDGTMMALGDAMRIAGQAYGMYNMASGLGGAGGSPTVPVDSGVGQITQVPGALPTPPPSSFGLGNAFTNGASRGFAGNVGYGVKQSIPLTKYFNYAG